MAFDYKKEYKEFYLPSRKPHLITVPPMNFVTVQGKGDPNDPAGEYQAAMEVLYGLAYTIKMSYKGSHRMEGFFEYVVPPLEGLWHQQGVDGVDYAHKETFEWTSMIRLPEFVTREEFDWPCRKPRPKRNGTFLRRNSGPMTKDYAYSACILALTTQSQETLRQMDAFAAEQGYVPDFTAGRLHHEIYLGDPRRTAPEKLKTVLRHPVRKK